MRKSQCRYCNVTWRTEELASGICSECTAVLSRDNFSAVYEEIVRRMGGSLQGIISSMSRTPDWADAAFNIDSKWMAVIVGKLKGDQRVRVEATGHVHNPNLYRATG